MYEIIIRDEETNKKCVWYMVRAELADLIDVYNQYGGYSDLDKFLFSVEGMID